jgi:hypothetical protein
MSVTEILLQIPDVRKENGRCAFNGYLEDYLTMIEEDHPMVAHFQELFEINPNFRLMVDYSFGVNPNLVTNQIIRYKDILKLPERPITVPYIVYGDTSKKVGVGFIFGGTKKEDYLISKGFYFALTEPEAIFQDHRNFVMACVSDPTMYDASLIKKVMQDQMTIGNAQRVLDNHVYKKLEEAVSACYALSQSIKEHVVTVIPSLEDRSSTIANAIVSWYLLKKAVYVMTMTNKPLLAQLENNVKAQRHQAKVNADSLVFMPLSEMWRL